MHGRFLVLGWLLVSRYSIDFRDGYHGIGIDRRQPGGVR